MGVGPQGRSGGVLEQLDQHPLVVADGGETIARGVGDVRRRDQYLDAPRGQIDDHPLEVPDGQGQMVDADWSVAGIAGLAGMSRSAFTEACPTKPMSTG